MSLRPLGSQLVFKMQASFVLGSRVHRLYGVQGLRLLAGCLNFLELGVIDLVVAFWIWGFQVLCFRLRIQGARVERVEAALAFLQPHIHQPLTLWLIY